MILFYLVTSRNNRIQLLPHSNMFTKVLMKAFCTILPICDYTNLAHNLQKEDNDSSIHEHFLLLRLQALS